MHKLKLFAAALVAAAGLALPAYATVSTTCVSQSYTGNGATTVFSFPCKFLKTTDLVVKVNSVTQTITTQYTVTGAGTGSSGQVTFVTAPANALAVTITRVTDKTQGTSLRGSRSYDPGTVEDAIDRTVLIEQELNAGIAVSQNLTDASGATAQISGGSTSATLAARWGDLPNVKRDFGAVADGSTDDSAAFSSMISAKTGVLFVPASSTCYNLGTTGIALAAGRILQGAGMGGASSGPTCLKYTGTGCAITIDSISYAGVRDIDVQVDTTSATARGVCIKSTSAIAEFNKVEHVSIKMVNATRRTVGQIAFYMNDAVGNGVFWNTVKDIRTAYWDTGFKIDGVVGNGVNANHLEDLMTWGHVTGLSMLNHSDDNRIYNLFCSRSDGTYAGVSTCLSIPDANAAIGNHIHLTNDAAGGAGTVCATLGTTAGANILYADCESGGPVTDNYTGTLKNEIHEQVANRVYIGRLYTSDALIIGTSFTGIAGVGSAGGAVAIQGGVGAAGFAGGDLNLKSGAAGTGGFPPGNVTVTPGARSGSAGGGVLVLGPDSAQGASGIRNASSRIIVANKPVGVVDCAGAAVNPTVSTLLDGSFFTCATSQTITLPTAKGASGIVQNLPGTTGKPVAVGDYFEFFLSENHATNTFTLAANADASETIYGIATITNGSRTWRCQVASVAVGSESLTCR